MKRSYDADSLIQVENESIGDLKNSIIDLKNSDVNAEIGPLKYISDLTGLPMDNVINYIILVLIFIFDPAAILMLIAANNMFDGAKKQLEELEVDPIEEKPLNLTDEENYFDDLEGLYVENKIKEQSDLPSFSGATIQEISEEGYVIAYSGSTEEKSELENKAERFFEEKEKKKEEFLELIEEKNKELETPVEVNVENIDLNEEISEEVRDTLYTKFIKILFKDGEIKKGDTLPSYEEFEKLLSETKIRYNEKLIRDFLTTCILLKIIPKKGGVNRKALKSLDEARRVILLIG